MKLPTFDELETLAMRLETRREAAAATADALDKIKHGCGRPRRQEAADLSRTIELLGWMAARADRLSVLAGPVTRPNTYGSSSSSQAP